MDTMTFTKAAGALCGALLVFLLGKWAAEELYHVSGHGEQAYVIETGVEDAPAEEEDSGPGILEVMASADPEAGAGVFRKCQSCHKLEEGANGTGPYLYGVVGRDIAAAEGYSYSDALAGLEGDWTVENLSAFLQNPQDYAPGTTMSFAGLRDIQDRADVIAYLDGSDGETLDYASLAAEAGSAGDEADAAEEGAAEGEADAASEEVAAAETEADATSAEEPAEGEAEPAAAEGETDAAADEAAAEGETDAGASEEAAAAEGETDAGATEEAAADEAAADEGGSAILASADPAAGERVFRKCQACHKLEEGQNGVGPHLYGVVGRDIASVEGYSYSDALSGKDGAWDPATLDAFLLNPKEWAPGTKMSFAGLRKDEERANVIAYLNSIGE